MTETFWLQVSGFFLTLGVTIWGFYKYLQSRLDREEAARRSDVEKEQDARDKAVAAERHERNVQLGMVMAKAEEAQRQLHAYQLDAARTFATKEGVTEATGRLMDAIRDVGSDVRGVSERLDRVIEGRPLPRGGHAD